METKKTSLYQLHHDNRAKFVEFAGYQMPIQYSDGIVEEHKFTRSMSESINNFFFFIRQK